MILPIVLAAGLAFGLNAPAQATALHTLGTSSIDGDSVVGSGTAGFSTFAIDAHTDASGENAAGTVSFELLIGSLSGPVNYLCVNGNQAVVAGSITAGPFTGSGYALHVQDNELAGTSDQMRLEILGGDPGACPGFSLISPAGDVVVIDSVPVTFASLKALTLQYVLGSGRTGAEGIANGLSAIMSAAEQAAN